MSVPIRAVLFDLDGTLVDTAPDLGAALNAMRARRGLGPIVESAYRPQSSHGSQGLLRLGFGVDQRHPDFPALQQEFLEHYAANLTCNSPLFPGMTEVLEYLDACSIKWGVVTNKPACYTEPLLSHLGLVERAAFIVSGDTCAHPKPHPVSLLYACDIAQVSVRDCLYVGDAERDVQAANAAGMPALVALYGYLGPDDQPTSWEASGYLDSALDLITWIARSR